MIRNVIFSSAALLLTVSGCGKSAPCEDLAKRLCETSAEHCDAAGPWLTKQGSVDGAVCKAVLDDATALAGYMTAFAASVAPTPAAPATAAPTPATAPTPAAGAPDKPTTREQVKEVGATIEEVGKATEKAGEAIDKLRDAVKTDEK